MRWIGSHSFYSVMRFLVLCAALGAVGFGFFPYVLGPQNDVATMWVAAFLLMLLLWLLELKVRKDFYLKAARM